MTTGMIVFWVVVGLLVVFACWLMIQAKNPIDALEENNEAPYKVEKPFDPEINPAILAAFEDAPLPSKPKRKYTKRSKYWGSPRHKAKLRKARSAKKAKSKQEA